ncbi:MAG: DUF5752 family protein [bacterium]
MANNQTEAAPFAIKDCALIAIATGQRAQNLRELKDQLQTITTDSIYYHFWGGLLRPRFDDPEYHNDFAIWARHSLHEKILSERLSLVDPTEFATLEDLRQELIEILEERLDEVDYPLWTQHDNQFEFIRSQIVIFDTHHEVKHPREFVRMLPQISVGSIFYHFIDAPRRNESGLDDFQNWIKDLGEECAPLCQAINEIDPYFSTLTELRSKLTEIFVTFFSKGRK